MITISGTLEILTMIDLFGFLTIVGIFEFLVYTEEIWVKIWIVLKKHKRIYEGIS